MQLLLPRPSFSLKTRADSSLLLNDVAISYEHRREREARLVDTALVIERSDFGDCRRYTDSSLAWLSPEKQAGG